MSKRRIKKFYTADCETDPFLYGRIPEPFVWGIYGDDIGFNYFYETTEFVDFIKELSGIIYFHNGGKFDVHFLLPFVESQENIMVINGRIAKIKIGNVELRDSYLLLPVPLSAYKKDEIDYKKFEKTERKNYLEEIIKYLKGDCVYLYEILLQNFEIYGQKLTLASSAFDFWHKNFNERKNKPKTNQSFFEIFKPFYFGGRVQCFKKGIIENEFSVYDINSAYPYAMLNEHPYGENFEILDYLPEIDELHLCFIEFYGISNGLLPIREKGNITNYYNDNEIRHYRCGGYELKKGLELGLIKIEKIIRVYKFFESINFIDYVNHFYNEKNNYKNDDSEAGKAKYLLAKLYLNSLYGKFGQSPLDHREFCLVESQYIEGYFNAGYEYESEIGELCLMSSPIAENKYNFYNVAVSASITSFVRAYLFEHIYNSKEPLYCDTDSIACKSFSGKIGKDLGEWGKEGDFKRGAIAGKKLYAFERKDVKKSQKYKISSKGVKLNGNQIFSIAKGESVLYKSDVPTFSVKKSPIFLERLIKLT